MGVPVAASPITIAMMASGDRPSLTHLTGIGLLAGLAVADVTDISLGVASRAACIRVVGWMGQRLLGQSGCGRCLRRTVCIHRRLFAGWFGGLWNDFWCAEPWEFCE